MTVDLMRRAREKLRSLRKHLIWVVIFLLFVGSLGASELLGTDPKKFDSSKTLFGGDVKMLNVEAKRVSDTTQAEGAQSLQNPP